MRAQWDFENDAQDGSGNGNHGTLQGAAGFTPDEFGQALDLRDPTAAVTISTVENFKNLQRFTLEARVKPTATTAIQRPRTIMALVDPNRDFNFHLNAHGNLGVHFAHNAKYYGCTSDQIVPFDAWTHVGAAWDGEHWTLYIDGKEAKVCSAHGAKPMFTGQFLTIGGLQTRWGRYEPFTGYVDEVRVYSGVRKSHPRLFRRVAQWRFDGNFLDSSGHGNDIPNRAHWLDGAERNVSFVPGKFGQAIDLNSGRLHAVANNRIPPLQSFTVSAWIRPTAGGSRWQTIIAKVSRDEERVQDFVVQLDGLGPWRNLVAFFRLDLGPSFLYIACESSEALVGVDEWYHVAAAWDHLRFEWRLYVNYVPVGRCGSPYKFNPEWIGENLAIGGRLNRLDRYNYFIGAIDQLEIWDGALEL